jgi:hypothetical protein
MITILSPTRLLDYNPSHLYLWGHLKQFVYTVDIYEERMLQEKNMKYFVK